MLPNTIIRIKKKNVFDISALEDTEIHKHLSGGVPQFVAHCAKVEEMSQVEGGETEECFTALADQITKSEPTVPSEFIRIPKKRAERKRKCRRGGRRKAAT